jgi:hypothetical protein
MRDDAVCTVQRRLTAYDRFEICTSLFARFSAATLRLRCVVFLADGGKLRPSI